MTATELERLTHNFKDAVRAKRRTGQRLKTALAALQQIYTVCGENDTDTCSHRMALKFVREVAGNAFNEATEHPKDWKDYEWSDDDDLGRLKADLLNDLPIEIWTESDIGQILLRLAKEGCCRYIRLNSTLGRFER